MGFKRTTEGRVFFQNGGADAMDNSNKRPLSYTAPDQRPVKANASDATQGQIIALLKSLNSKLETTQADREKLQQELETYKVMVLSLQDKTRRFESEAKDIKKQIEQTGQSSAKSEKAEQLSREALKEFEETRRLMAEIEEKAERTEALLKKQQAQTRQNEEHTRIKWETLEQTQKKQSQEINSRLNKTEDVQKRLDSRVEESMNTALKVERKIEKAVQDRTRLLRKLERIEETVLQTNEALNARAMVLLTDQNTAHGSGYPNAPALGANQDDGMSGNAYAEADNLGAPWWQKPMQMRATSASVIVLSAVLLGWFVSNIQKPGAFEFTTQMPDFTSFAAQMRGDDSLSSPPASQFSQDAAQDEDITAAVEPVSYEKIEFAENGQGPSAPTPQASMSAEEARAFDEVIAAQPTSMATDVNNDINAIDLNDEEQLLALLEENPDALAARLNAIEPAALTPQEAAVSEPVVSEPALAPAVAAPQNNLAARQLADELATVALPSELNGPIESRISPDSSLPAQIKEIETSALAGSAEAQHDLAAIYVAGHGGVTQNFERASLWFEEAAHNGIANARYNLGVLYHQGIGVEQNTETAFNWYKTAAALGHPEAQYNLGIAYIEGIGVQYNPQNAAIYFENAANGGVMEAAYNLGLIYENGLLGQTKPDTALMWYKRAADQGSPEAKAALEQLAKTLGMTLTDVNKLIEGMEVLNTASAQKKTEKLDAVQAMPKRAEAPAEKAADGRQNIVAKVQQQLITLGLYPGPVDGVGGMMTSDAVRSYQSRNNLSVDGQITDALLSHMQFQSIGASEEGVNEQGSRER